jgi:hypothetical protein
MYDQELAGRMSRGAGDKLVNAIVSKIEAKKAYESQKFKQNMEREGADRIKAGLSDDTEAQIIASRRLVHAATD